LWRGFLSFGLGPNGKRRRVSVYGKTKAEIVDKLHAADRGTAAIDAYSARATTLTAFVARWLADTQGSLAASTQDRYASLLRIHIEPNFGDFTLGNATAPRLQATMTRLQGNGVTPRVLQQIRTLLHRALQQAVEWRLLGANPVTYVSRARTQPRPIRPLSAQEARRLLDASEGNRLHALFVLAVATGLRRGELLGLQWGDVDLDARTLSVRRAVVAVAGEALIVPTKTRSGQRSVHLSQRTVAALRKHPREDGCPWIFASKGGPVHPRVLILRYFEPLLKRAGLPHIRFHDLRHTTASLLLQAGVNPKIVQEQLGHSSVRLTLDTYSHLMGTMQAESAQKIDALLGR